MNKGEIYDSLIRSWRWQRLRARVLGLHPCCQDCEERDVTTLATEVHHVVPIETAGTRAGMERLAYDENNLVCLCHQCHEARHGRLRAAKMEPRSEEAKKFLSTWLEGLAQAGPGV